MPGNTRRIELGPFHFETQIKRAEAIKQFIERNPNMTDVQRAMWEDKMRNIAYDPKTYYERYKTIFVNGEEYKRSALHW